MSVSDAARAGDDLQSAHYTCRQSRWDAKGPIPPTTSDQTTPSQRSQRQWGGDALDGGGGEALDGDGRSRRRRVAAAVLFDDGGGNEQRQQWKRMECQAV